MQRKVHYLYLIPSFSANKKSMNHAISSLSSVPISQCDAVWHVWLHVSAVAAVLAQNMGSKTARTRIRDE